MDKQKMSIHRALAELKLIDAKITRACDEIVPVAWKHKDGLVANSVDPKQFETSAKAQWQKVTDLIERKALIKSLIMQSNSKTVVKVAGKEMTVADAIFTKDVISAKDYLLSRIKAIKANVAKVVDDHNAKMESQALELAKNSMGNANINPKDKDVLAITEPFCDKKKIAMVDPLNINEKIESLQNEIEDFRSEVDAILSESNAVTMIEV